MMMPNRIEKKFKSLKRGKKKALILFMTCGDPSLAKNEALAIAFENNGVDMIELGIPFSDPLADGPVIQAASERSLRRRTSLKKILKLVRSIRKKSQIPLLLMGYLNPILHYGIGRFAKDAQAAGVDGLIIPDLVFEESREISAIFKHHHLLLIHFLAPTTTASRRRVIARVSRGFIYYVSVAGVTGVKHASKERIRADLKRVRLETKTPVCVGFGVSTPAIARQVSEICDGVIVGSAVVRALHEHRSMPTAKFVAKYVKPFVTALRRGN